MSKLAGNIPNIKRSGNDYRLIIMNEDTYEEVVKFRLSKWSVYAALSTIFVLLVALTASIIIFTPLKYYLPGAGVETAKSVKEYRELKLKADSTERALKNQERYLDDLQKVLRGKIVNTDSNRLAPNQITTDEKFGPAKEGKK